jgi:hypothetical protein
MHSQLELDLCISALLVLLLIPAAIFGAIFRKAGYSGWLGLLMLVPLAEVGQALQIANRWLRSWVPA